MEEQLKLKEEENEQLRNMQVIGELEGELNEGGSELHEKELALDDLV